MCEPVFPHQQKVTGGPWCCPKTHKVTLFGIDREPLPRHNSKKIFVLDFCDPRPLGKKEQDFGHPGGANPERLIKPQNPTHVVPISRRQT